MPDSDGALCLCTNERVAGVRTGGDAISDRAARTSTAAATSAAINTNYCSINRLLVLRHKLASFCRKTIDNKILTLMRWAHFPLCRFIVSYERG